MHGHNREFGIKAGDRSRQIKKNLIYGLFELIICGTCGFLIILYAPNGITIEQLKQFSQADPIALWTDVYGALYFLLFLRRLLLICFWKFSEDPRPFQAKCNFYTFLFLNTFEIGWFIYGNTIFWKPNGLQSRERLWLIMLTILFYGYINMIIYFLTLCAILTVFLSFWYSGFLDPKENDNYDDNI